MGNATWYPSDFLRYYTVDLAGLLVKGSPVFFYLMDIILLTLFKEGREYETGDERRDWKKG